MWATLAFGAAARLLDAPADRLTLAVYEAVLAMVVAGILVDCLYGVAARGTVADVAVDLGPSRARSLRDVLADSLADPSLVLGLESTDGTGLVDERGREVTVSTGQDGRVLTPLVDSGRRIAVIEHDAEVLRDPRLLESVVALARVAVTNATMEREVTEQVAAVRASRRRLLSVGDDQRTQLESELRSGPQARLARVEDLLTAVPDSAELRERLATCGAAISAFARGVHPRMLTERGLADALAELVDDDAASPVALDVPPDRFQPAVEAAAYFVCAESLTNVAKYARATEVRLRIAATDDLVVIEITDDGVGGANPARGSGLVSLTDRVEALDGTLQVVSTPGLGTRVKAVLPRRVDRAEPG